MTTSLHTPRYQRLVRMLADRRNTLGLSQKELGRRLRRNQSFVTNYERGQRRLDVIELIDIADALGLDVAALVREIQGKRRKG